jgi:hypothetical protein
MSTSLTVNSLIGTIPALGDAANVVTAFTDYHTSLANTSSGAAVLNRANTFTGSITLGTSTATLLFNDGTNVEGRMLASSGVLYIQAGTTNADTSAQLNIARHGTTSTNISALNLYANDITLGGSLNLVAGTTSVEPLKFSSGTNLTTIIAGAVEYDGNVFYATPKVNNTTYGRGLVLTPYLFVESSNIPLTQSSAVSTGSGGGTSTDSDVSILFGSQYLAASSTYVIDSLIMVYHNLQTQGSSGTVTASATLGFTAPSGSTVSFDVIKTADLDTLTTSGTPSSQIYDSGTITIKSVSASDDTGYSIFRVRGVVRTSATAGLFNPVINTAVVVSNDLAGVNAATAQCTLQANSYISVTPVGGTTGDINIGGWA